MKIRGMTTINIEIDRYEAFRIMCKALGFDKIFNDDFNPDHWKSIKSKYDDEEDLYMWDTDKKKWVKYTDAAGKQYEAMKLLYYALGGR